MEHHEFESILEAKLNPLKETIEKLEVNYEKVVELLTAQARHEEGIKRVKEDVAHLFSRVRDIEKESGNKTWDVLKILATAFVGGIIGAVLVGLR
ncbi:MAG: hypothetical protein HY886_08350 [Deltaproteobacteria bacterium]|nr:hypothetical protein [Deltaproteobacteria bacterium]